MLEEMIKKLSSLNGTPLKISIATDEEGFLDRECPSEECKFLFKVHEDDWKEVVDKAFCPRCKHESSDDNWCTEDQVNYARQKGFEQITGQLNEAIKNDVRKFNAKQPHNSFFSMKMEFKANSPSIEISQPIAETMRQKICCEFCSCKYSAIGNCFFCPACGERFSPKKEFYQSITNIETKIQHLGVLEKALEETLGKDAAKNFLEEAIYNDLQNIVGAFQHFAFSSYKNLPNSKNSAKANDFQILEKGSKLWKEATGVGYEDIILPNQLSILEKSFQRRHQIAHIAGTIDAQYLTKSGDTSYKEGQRIVIKPTHIKEILDPIRSLADGLADSIAKTAP